MSAPGAGVSQRVSGVQCEARRVEVLAAHARAPEHGDALEASDTAHVAAVLARHAARAAPVVAAEVKHACKGAPLRGRLRDGASSGRGSSRAVQSRAGGASSEGRQQHGHRGCLLLQSRGRLDRRSQRALVALDAVDVEGAAARAVAADQLATVPAESAEALVVDEAVVDPAVGEGVGCVR